MYSYEERMRAVLVYIQYDHSASATVRELGYPTTKMLKRWYRDYEATGELPTHPKRRSRYSIQQQQAAVEYFFAHGRSISRTIRALGYPRRDALKQWIDTERPGERKISVRHGSVSYSVRRPYYPWIHPKTPLRRTSGMPCSKRLSHYADVFTDFSLNTIF